MSADHHHHHGTPGRKRAAQVLTFALIAGILGVFAYRQRTRTSAAASEESGPESAVWRMVDASRTGDIETYLNCYTGDLQNQLRRNAQEMGSEKFGAYLKTSYAQVKGIAVSAPQMASATEARVPVEYVYQDRNELQQVHVRGEGKMWRIFRVDSAERVKTLVPYGTPVAE